MKKAVPIGIIVVVIVVVVAVVLANRQPETTTPNTTSPSQSSSTTNQPVSSSSVSIKDLMFSPDSITVKKGTTVTWTNQDSTAHTVTGDSGGPDSGTLANGKSYSFTFNTAGTFAYHCNFHSDMHGTVVVTQ